MGFQLPITIAEVIQGMERNGYVLPAIQREFVWDGEQIEKLFDSLMRGYPIGSFLFWRVDPDKLGEFQFYRFMDHYHERDYKHNEPIHLVGRHDVIAVLDGQQRLTAINIGLKGWYADKLPYYHWKSENAFPKRHLYLNLLEPTDDMEFAYEFKILRDKDLETKEVNKLWFRVGDVLQFKELDQVYDYCHDQGLMQMSSKFPYKTLIRLWEVIRKKEIVNYFLEEEQDLDKVLNIFIRVNSGGTPLSYSDMLLSIATAQWQEKDARQEIHGLVDGLNEMGEGFNFNKDFILKSCLVLSDSPAIEFKVNNFNKKNMLKFESDWDEIARTLRLTASLLASWGYNRQTLVSNNAVIPLAYYLYKKGAPTNFVDSSHFRDDRDDMRYWLMLALLKRIFSGQPDYVLRTIRKVLADQTGSFPVQTISEALAGTPKSLAFDKADLDGLLGYQYDQSYTFSVLALLYPWLKYDHHFHKDHIFPRSLFNERELTRRQIPRSSWSLWLDNVNGLANLQLLEGTLNQEKSAIEPRAWLDAICRTPAEIQIYRERHFIPDMPLTFETFPDFLRKREKLIIERLAQLLRVPQPVKEIAQ